MAIFQVVDHQPDGCHVGLQMTILETGRVVMSIEQSSAVSVQYCRRGADRLLHPRNSNQHSKMVVPYQSRLSCLVRLQDGIVISDYIHCRYIIL